MLKIIFRVCNAHGKRPTYYLICDPLLNFNLNNNFMKKCLLFFEKGTGKDWRSAGVSTLLSRLFFVSLFLLFTGTSVWSQTRTVTGTVLDENGAPVAGVAVVVEGTQRGTTTDGTGKYSLPNVDGAASLNFNFVGYATQVVPVNNRSVVDVSMATDNTLLDEVIVVGYGTLRRSDVTGAVSRISDKDISSRPVTNAVQAMQGKLAGVDITSSTRPGTLGEVRIRGNRSIGASNDPLYVVDGIPLVSGTMADINPSDVESIEVLKDASATAIYGSRAANGVILVSTKKGQSGRTSINYDGSITFSRINSLTDWMTSGERLDWQREGNIVGENYGGRYGNAPDPNKDLELYMGNAPYMKRILATAYQLNNNDPANPVLRAATAAEKAMGYADMVPVYDSSKLYQEDWVGQVLRTGISQTHNLSVSAGSDRSSLYTSIGYYNDQSPMKDQDYERFTVNMNGSTTPVKWLRITNVLSGNYSVRNYGMADVPSNNGGAKDAYGQALALELYAPTRDEDGSMIYGVGNGPSGVNVVHNQTLGFNEYREYSARNNFSAEVTLLPWLKYQYRLGAQMRNRRQGSYYDDLWINPSNAEATRPSTGYYRTDTYFNWEMENMLFAHKEFGKHVVDVTLLQSASNQYSENSNMRAVPITYPSSKWYNLNSNGLGRPTGYGTGYSTRSLASYMARVNYSFNDRYLLTASARWDGASVLAKGHKWDFFPSAALAWKMEQEEFIKNVPWIQQLKLRLGYGVTGQQSVSPYSTTGSLTSSWADQNFNNVVVAGSRADVMPNANLGWEKTATTNIGLDFAILNFRVNGSVEYYMANTFDLLLNRSIPAPLGYMTVRSNIGKTKNHGVEVTLSTVNVKAGDFTWTTDLNWTRNREEVVEASNGKVDQPADNLYIGYPQTTQRVSQYDRLWQDTPEDLELMAIYKAMGGQTYYPGTVKLVDQQPMIEVEKGTPGSKTVTVNGKERTFMNNGFGTLDADNDKVLIGSRRPDWTGGMTNTFTYRNWQFNFFIHARVGGIYNGLMQTWGRRVETDVWTPENTGAKYPRIGTPRTNGAATSHNGLLGWTSATIYSVRNVALSYTFPKSVLDKLNLASGSVYVQALNPFIFGSELIRTGINPDDANGWGTSGSGDSGVTNNTMLVRSYVIGLRLGF